ncbi:MAG: Type 1 glutamine amidotransferase-like domain-containing protein [Acholeplasmataceae bacterium]|nr:Type 1 glutamine amidotransferase-like domain-containing protein [Acholeplasmataceae bacterium]
MRTHILMSRGILKSEHVINLCKPLIKATDQVVIVNLSFFPFHLPDEASYRAFYGPDSLYHQKMIDSFEPYGIKASSIRYVDYYDDDESTAKRKIEEADILYFPGGAPDLLMDRVNQKKLKESIEAHKGLVIGSSAGAMVQFRSFHISPDNEYPVFIEHQGLDMIDAFAIEVHYRRRVVQKKAMRRVWKKTRKDLYVIPDDGVLVYDGSQVMCAGSARKHYGKKGVIASRREAGR